MILHDVLLVRELLENAQMTDAELEDLTDEELADIMCDYSEIGEQIGRERVLAAIRWIRGLPPMVSARP